MSSISTSSSICKILLHHILIVTWMQSLHASREQYQSIKHDLPRYQYEYAVQSDNSDGQEKIEARFGELPSGQYYINSDEASTTDVKYYTDGRGYHPFVKLATSNSYSTASTQQLPLDNHPTAAALSNDSRVVDIQQIPSSVQYDSTIDLRQSGSLGNVPIGFTSADNVHQHQSTRITTLDKLANRVTELTDVTVDPQNSLNRSIINEEISRLGTNNQVEKDTFPRLSEDALLIETSGAFGQRVRQPPTSSSQVEEETTEASSRVTSNYYSSTEIPNLPTHQSSTVNFETSSYNYKSALASLRKYFGLTNNNHSEEPINSNNLNKIANTRDNNNIYPTSETIISPRPTIFSKPIIVAELPNSQSSAYSTTFPCIGDNIKSIDDTVSSTSPPTVSERTLLADNIGPAVFVTPTLQDQARITTSSAVLNPIQVGVALVNAGKSHLIVGDVEASLTVPISENEFNENTSLDSSQALKEIEDDRTMQWHYPSREKINSGVDEFQLSSSATTTNVTGSPLNTDHNVVEIQRSLELYHSSPIQEIYYPPSQATVLEDTIDQRDKAYLSNVNHEAKQPLQGNQYTSEGLGDSSSSINTSFEYQSLANPSAKALQEFETSPEGNDPAFASLSQQQQQQQKAYVNNAVLENFKHSEENYRAQGTTSDNRNLPARSKVNQRQPTSSLTEFTKLPYALATASQQADKMREGPVVLEKDTVENMPRVQSTLQRILSDSSVASQRQEADGLNYRDKHQKTFDYPKPEINLAREKMSSAGVYGASSMQIETKIQANEFPIVGNKDENTYLLPVQKMRIKNVEIIGHDRDHYGNSFANSRYIQETKTTPQSQVYPAEKSLESVIEKILPPLGQSYPVQQAYPPGMGKIVENKVPYPIHKLAIEPYPIHLVEPQSVYQTEEKPSHISQEIPNKLSHPIEELAKLPSALVRLPIGIQFGIAYQQPMINPQAQEYYAKPDMNALEFQYAPNSTFGGSQGHLYDNSDIRIVPMMFKRRFPGLISSVSSVGKHNHQLQHQSLNSYQIGGRKKSNQLRFQGSVDQPTAYPRYVTHLALEKQGIKNLEYVGPLPPAQHALNVHQPSQVLHPAHQEPLRQSTDVASPWRRMRMPEIHQYARMGNFRQSKMEYGFKPPMVPSVQYDEKTATKIQS